ncbi:MAG: PAS domain-containing sensor histidine kinase [Rhodobacteraceae bacterium]|nr:MAG: PAS domain-containing sensor histidine kinase [Paracoccaceae bacterium]
MVQTIYENVWSALPFPSFLVDKTGGISDANGAAETLITTSQRHMKGKNISRFFGANSIVLATITQAAKDFGSVTQYNVDVAILEQPVMTCNVYVSFLSADMEQLLVVVQPTGVAQKMSRSLTNLSAARSVTAMAAMLAHEIRNPLAGISGAAQLLAMNASPQDLELAEMIGTEAKRIGQLVDRVEHFGDQRPMAAKPVNIHDVLDRAKRSAQAGFGVGVEFSVDFDPSLPDAAGDPDQLLQVFQNLLKNAAEAVDPARGTIKIRTSYNSSVKLAMQGAKTQNLPLQIEIIDNGRGIPASLITEIFEPFVSSKSNGTGLGLSLVSKIIAGHGGLVECSSTEGRTVFCVRLPVWNGK